MITHIVLVKPKPAADTTAVENLRKALADLLGVIPGLLSFAWGANVSPEGKTQGYDLGFVMTFEGTAARDSYLLHSARVAVQPLAAAVADAVLVFDLET